MVIMAGYIYNKGTILAEKSGISVTSAYVEDFFDDTDKFSAEKDSFFIAAALSGYNGLTEMEEDEDYGVMTIEHYGWGYGDTIESIGTPLETHPCTDEELGLVEDQSVSPIFPVKPSLVKEVTTWKKKFKCVEPEELVIWGNFNAAKA